MTEGFSKGRQKTISPESNHVITIITTSPCIPLLTLNKPWGNYTKYSDKMENKKIS